MSPGDRLDCAPQYLDNCSHVASPWQVGSVTQGPPKNRSDRGWIRVQVRESFLQRMGSCDYGGRQVPSAAAHRPKTAVEQFNLSLKAETHRGWEGEEPGEEEEENQGGGGEWGGERESGGSLTFVHDFVHDYFKNHSFD